MYNDNFCFKYLGTFNTENIQNKLKTLTNDDWEEYSYRQITFDVHRKTLTLPLLFNENFDLEPLQFKYYNTFKSDLDELEMLFKELYGSGKFVRCILVNLLAGAQIPIHVDGGESLEISHRHHIPIITNDAVFFQIGDEINNLKTNTLWEINNQKPHGVWNDSTQDRIHMIVDWIEEKDY
jgi:hypothetical protein